jgi:hypothetical protein
MWFPAIWLALSSAISVRFQYGYTSENIFSKKWRIYRQIVKNLEKVTKILQCVYSKWGYLENTDQSHGRTKIEKINKRRISQSALGQKQFILFYRFCHLTQTITQN